MRVRLAITNSVGFAATTVMPLWIGSVAQRLGMPPAFAGVAVLALVGTAAGVNLVASRLVGAARLQPAARLALVAAATGQMVCAYGTSTAFLIGCLLAGAASGLLLNITNRAMGSIGHVQRGYAMFVLVEICFASVLFVSCSELAARFGLLAMFPAMAGATLLGLPILGRVLAAIAPDTGPTLPTTAIRKATLGLMALALFFVGQASLNSFMPSIGQAVGLDPAVAGRVIGLGMPFGFAGALGARLLGEGTRPLPVIAGVVVVLAAAGLALTSWPTIAVFVATVVVLAASTMLSVPYFFAVLGSHDSHGRFTALGPAMMLGGIGIGPAIAVLLHNWAGLPAVGVFSAILLVLAGWALAASTAP